MKIVIVCLSVLLFSFSGLTQSQKLKVYLDTKQFYEPSTGNFIEINFQFVGPSISYKGVEHGLKGELAIILEIIQESDTLISDAFRLETPLMRDSIVEDFYDIRRFSLAPGNYKLYLQIFDLNKDDDAIVGNMKFTIEDKSENICFGDIQNVEYASQGDQSSAFFKSGFDIVPRLSNYYPEQLTALPYYTEIYNSERLGIPEFGVKETIFSADTKIELEEYSKIYRYKSNKVVSVLRQINIKELPSGNYYLSLSIIDNKMEAISEKIYFFERTNNESFVLNDNLALDPAFEKSIPKDSIPFFLASLLPLAKGESALTILNSLKEKNDEKSLKLIQSFWLSASRATAYESWLKYKQQVIYIEKLYSNTFLRGYESDRGRVYLQYGAPTNVMARDASVSELPYEIWQYDKIERFSNKRFVFYNPDLIANNYRLLHSDLIGEPKNLNWSVALQVRNAFNGDTDSQNKSTPDYFGGQSNDLFRQY